jgi:hypothetical protein
VYRQRALYHQEPAQIEKGKQPSHGSFGINHHSVFKTSTYSRLSRGKSRCFRSVSPDNQLCQNFQFFLEIDHVNMTDRVILAPIVHALSTKHIVGTLAAALKRVRTLFIWILLLLLSLFLFKFRPTKMERLHVCQSRKSMWDQEMFLFQSACRM